MLQGKEKKRNALFLLFILAFASLYYFFYSKPPASIAFSQEENAVIFSNGENNKCTFLLDDVTEIELVTAPDYGECIDGGTSFGGNMYGIWKSDTLGEYQSYASSKIAGYVVLRDSDKTAIFNRDNLETTSSLYNELLKYWTK